MCSAFDDPTLHDGGGAMNEPRTKAGQALLAAASVGGRLRLLNTILAIEAEASQPLREWWGRVIAVVPAKYRAEFDEQFRAALAQPQQPVLREARAMVAFTLATGRYPDDHPIVAARRTLLEWFDGRILAHPTSSPEDKR